MQLPPHHGDQVRPASITLKPVNMPAGEPLPPGWFALNPEQFDGEAEQARAHGRWFRIATGHGAVFRALQLAPGLPREGVALDWSARRALEGGHAGVGAENLPMRLDIRSAYLFEYPRCLLGHPSPAARLGGVVMLIATLLCAAALLATAVVGIGARIPDHVKTTAGTDVAVAADKAAQADPAGFIAMLAGDWQGPRERLLIKNDKGVVEILRQTRAGNGEIRLDQFVAAPVRLDAAQRRLELETAEGLWLLILIPGERRAQLSITYPDKRNVLYQ